MFLLSREVRVSVGKRPIRKKMSQHLFSLVVT